MRRFILLCAAAVAMFAGLSPAASAATKTWVGGSGANWSTAANWSPSGAPIAGDLVQFNSPATSNANLGTVAIGAVVFGANSGGSVINGTIRINAAAAPASNFEDNATGAANTINANIVLSAGRSWFKSSTLGHTLEFKGTISGDGSENGIRIYGPGTVKFNLNFDNSYVGATTVNSADANGGNGLLQIAGNAFSVIPGEFVVGTSTTASSAADRPQAQWITSQVVADGSKVTVGPDGLLVLGINNEVIAQLSGTGSITTTGTFAALTVGDAGDFTWGGVISGTGNVNKVGTGSMTYTAVNAYTGTTIVSGGTLVLDAPSRTIFGPLNIGLGVGTTTTATVRLAYDDQINDTSLPITINADGKLDADGFYESLGTVNMNGGQFALAGNVRIFGGLTMNGGTITDTGGGELEMRSNVVATSTAPFGAASINATVVVPYTPTTFTVNSGSTQPELTINGVVKVPGDPSNLIKTGAGTLRLAGTAANTYGGSTTIAQGTLELAKPDNVGAISGPIVIGNNTDPAGSATLKNMASNQLIGKPDVKINLSGVYQVADASTPRTETIGKLSGFGKLFLPFRPELTIDFPSGESSFFGVIDDPAPNASGNKRINKRGGGTQIFNLNTTYDGSLVVDEGVLSVNGQMAQAPVYIQGGTLRGNGRVGDVEVGSNVAAMSTLWPGSAFGILTTGAAAFSFGPSARLHIDLPSATPGTHGRLSVTGAFRPGDNDGGSLYVNPINNPTPANGTVFEIVSKVSAGVATSTFLGLPEGRSVYMGARNGKISYVGGDGNDVTLTVAPTLDIDGDSRYLAETDGLLITRYIRGLTGPALATQVVATSAGARRTVNADVEAYLAHLGNALDVDQNGVINSTDSTLILRYMFGFRGAALIAGVPLPGGENANTVAARIAALTP